MALIIEDGTGVSGANTYASLATVDSYCSDRAYEAWTGNDDIKNASILRGMAYVESFFYKGKKVASDQALKWPRSGMTDEDGYTVDEDAIPLNLKYAVSEAAFREIQNPGTLQADLTSGIKKEKIAFDFETEYFPGAPAQKILPGVDDLLVGFTSSPISIEVVRSL